jgi:16S rRNA (guanine527-N7)-methyltransferase
MMMLSASAVRAYWGDLDESQTRAVLVFYEALLEENTKQNLTRLTSPKDFLDGHLRDVQAIQECGFLDHHEHVLDLGSGGGVPGLLAGALDDKQWTLVDSEASKVQFLNNTAQLLDAQHRIQAVANRIELYVHGNNNVVPQVIISRAVGPVERLYNWIRSGTQWNTLILLKGRNWEQEFDKFQKSRYGHELVIKRTYEYFVGEGDDRRRRVIVELERVKRTIDHKKESKRTPKRTVVERKRESSSVKRHKII